MNLPETIVENLLNDLRGRTGFSDVCKRLELDVEDELRARWTLIIRTELISAFRGLFDESK